MLLACRTTSGGKDIRQMPIEKFKHLQLNILLACCLLYFTPRKLSRAASTADWICMCRLPACAQHSISSAIGSESNGIPRQWGTATYWAHATFPWWWRRCFSQSLSPYSSLAHSASPPPESNFTGSSKVASSQLPKSQLHVVWRCQL